MVQCQITPFFDANVLGLFGQLEAAVQEHAKAKRA